MHSRRKQNQEIERKKKQQQRMSVGIFAIVTLLIVAAIGWFVWDTRSRGWAMEFEGTRIPVSDFHLMEAMFGDQDTAVDALVQRLTLLDRANNAGVGFTDAELEEMRLSTHFNLQFAGLEGLLPVDRASELINVDTLWWRLFEIYAPEYIPDAEELAQEFAEYFAETDTNFYANIEVMYLTHPDMAVLASIRTMSGVEGFDFAEFVRENSFDYDPAIGVRVVTLEELFQEHWFQNEGEAWAMFELHEGEVSDVAEISGGMGLIAYVTSRTEATPAEIEEQFREWFIRNRRAPLFADVVEEWVADANYTVNRRIVTVE